MEGQNRQFQRYLFSSRFSIALRPLSGKPLHIWPTYFGFYPFSHAFKTITTEKQIDTRGGAHLKKNLAAVAIVPIRPALPLPDDLPDTVQTLLNTAAISL